MQKLGNFLRVFIVLSFVGSVFRGRKMKVRPSSADRVLKCAGSLDEGNYPVDEKSDEARDGRAKHAIAARYVAGTLGVSDIQKYADYYDVKADDLEEAALYVKQAWNELKEKFPEPIIEKTAMGTVCEGTSDIKSIVGGAILDWKFGWSHEEHPKQLLGYAEILLKELGNEMPECGYILAIEVFVRFKEYRVYKFTKEQILGFRAQVWEQLGLKGKQYNAGVHCKFCPRVNSCGARLDYMHATGSALATKGEARIWKPEELGQLYDRRRLFQKALDKYDEYLAEALIKGPIELGDGRVLEYQTQKTTAIAVNKDSWRLLTKDHGFEMEDMSKCLKLTKTAMEKIIAAKAGKGKGAAAKRDVMKNLKAAGAVHEGVKYVKKVRVVS